MTWTIVKNIELLLLKAKMVERGNLGKYKDGVGIEMVNLVFTQIDVLKKLKWKNTKSVKDGKENSTV